METQQVYYVGIDVSKAKLDVHYRKWNSTKTIENTPQGLKDLFQQFLNSGESLHIVCEATGGYEKPLMDKAFEKGISVSRINAQRVRDYAKAKGQIAKTDPIDAINLTEYGEIFKPPSAIMPSKLERELSSLARRRGSLVSMLRGEKVALEKESDIFVINSLNSSIGFLKKEVKSCEERISCLIESDEDLKAKKERLELVQGVGPTTSSILLSELPELGTIEDKKIAALVGLAPMNRDSGKSSGKRKIVGGRGLVRQALYMPALSASQHNPVLKEFYKRLRAENKAHNVALTAVMRKLICLLNKILADPDFVPQKTKKKGVIE